MLQNRDNGAPFSVLLSEPFNPCLTMSSLRKWKKKKADNKKLAIEMGRKGN